MSASGSRNGAAVASRATTPAGLQISITPSWLVFAADGPGGAPGVLLGQPGLWREQPESVAPRRVFEVPRWICEPFDRRSDAYSSVEAWARRTRNGRLHPAWGAPDRDQLESWLSLDSLTLQIGPHALQGELIREDRRVAVRFPVTSARPSSLSATRSIWLDRLLGDAARRWRLVRVAGDADGGIVAEVDSSGAPLELLPQLLRVSVDSLRHVVAALVEPAHFLLHGPPSRALDAATTRASGQQEEDAR